MQLQDTQKVKNPRKLDTDELELFIKCAKNDYANNEECAKALGFKSRVPVENVILKDGRASRSVIAAIRNFLSLQQTAA